VEKINGGGPIGRKAGVIGDQPNPPSGKRGKLLGAQDIDAVAYAWRLLACRSWRRESCGHDQKDYMECSAHKLTYPYSR
jgi:hypothetical protein